MAAVIAAPPGVATLDVDGDPFAPTPSDASHRQRYAGFDTSAFSLYSNGSPAQAKRALEAHLAETERRLQEASQLGSALVRQRSELAEKLKEVQSQHEDQDIEPELRQKLVALEKEFNEVGKETARAFIPKPRIPSNESAKSTEGVFESGGRDSPTKIQPPSLSSRKQRNQAPDRINDIKLATEISSSLLNQVRELQMAYAEKDDALKNTLAHKSQLELEMEGLMQRLRALDESEQRYKDENWTLETKIQELVAAARESNEREQKLHHSMKSTQSDKSNVERELEELKQAHGKLNDDHVTFRRQHETEVLSLKKTATNGESERAILQRKVDDLTSQNQELAKAVTYRFHAQQQGENREPTPEDDGDDLEGQITPDHSPPPSPTKGTPRHGALESETLKSSLHHAHRMIQNLKNNIHREKTEKLELRRMLQDARDELEIRRSNGDSGTKKRKSKDEIKEFKKPARPDRLGDARRPTSEILIDDEDWEDHDGPESPTRVAAGKAAARKVPIGDADSTDAFETATEHSDAFETAAETEAFHTGAESLAADSSGDLTETETSKVDSRRNRPAFATVNSRKGHERSESYQSTASTSGDEFDDVRTPVQNQPSQKFKIRMGRGNLRRGSLRSNALAADSSYRDSPASVASDGTGTSSRQTTPAGPSLFAELGDLDSSDDESETADTPSRSLASREASPEMQQKVSPLQQTELVEEPSRSEMIDSGIMTEPWEPSLIAKGKEALGAVLAGGIGFGLGRRSKDDESEQAEAGAEEVIETPKEYINAKPQPNKTTPAQLAISQIHSQEIEPVEVPASETQAPFLAASGIISQDTTPQIPINGVEKADLRSPASQPEAESKPDFAVSSIAQQETQPAEMAELERPPTAKRVAATDTSETIPPLPVEQPTTAPKDSTSAKEQQKTPDRTSKTGFLGMLGLGKSKAAPGTPPIAEDETSTKDHQPLRVYSDDIDDGFGALPGLENTRTPMKEIEPNAVSDRSPKKDGIALAKAFVSNETTDEGTQTMMSAEDLDRLMRKRSQPNGTALISPTVSSTTQIPQSPSKGVYGSQSPRRSRDSMIAADANQKALRRPGSSGSGRSRPTSPPPLPADYKQAIAAVAQRTSGVPVVPPAPTSPGQMGPPMMPASAYKTANQYRPPTATSYHANTSTPRASIRGGPSRSGVSSPVTRRSSVSSFASEIDQRFNITRGNMDGSFGFDSGTDPRMIAAITQTMIGEFLWKYTRKPGRETQSSTRHRRFFWVHPYTRTLYWSEQDPATAGRAQLKAKSVRIQAVRVVSDDNPFPPGLHRKSLVVVTPGREIMFTAVTSGRHETWFNALSYLLLRAGPERDQPIAEGETGDGTITAEDVDEFNPRSGYGGGAISKMSRRSRASLSSYNSRTTRNSSLNRQYPTLTPNDRSQRGETVVRTQSQTPADRGSISRRFSSFAGSVVGGSFASRYSGMGGQHAGQGYARSESGTTTVAGTESSIYDASVVRSSHDSAEDLRRVIEKQERSADRLENVRACCDGKHDVGSLSHSSRRGRLSSHRHSSPVVPRSQSATVHSRTTSQPLNAQA